MLLRQLKGCGHWEPTWEPSAQTTSHARRTDADRRAAIMPARGPIRTTLNAIQVSTAQKGVRVPPSAPTSEAPHLVREGPFSFLWEPRWSHRRVSATRRRPTLSRRLDASSPWAISGLFSLGAERSFTVTRGWLTSGSGEGSGQGRARHEVFTFRLGPCSRRAWPAWSWPGPGGAPAFPRRRLTQLRVAVPAVRGRHRLTCGRYLS